MKLLSLCIVFSAIVTTPVGATNIVIDFSDSTSAFFDNSPDGLLAQAAVQAAANDLSNALTTSLNSLSTYAYQGISGGTTVTITNTLRYTNPETGVSTIFGGALAADEFRIYAGARSLTGSTLGQGGPGGISLSAGVSGFPSTAQAAADLASANSSAGMTRGAHVISTISGSFGGSFVGTSYSTSYGPTLGNLWFDNDGSSSWHLDHTTPVGAGTNDLYSVALHEMIHALGIGSSTNWNNLVSGTTWLGSEASALHGTGVGLIDSVGSHVEYGIMSTRLSDGALQEVVMDPNITTGTRKELTELDLAFLRDIGWQTIPEPSTALLLSLWSVSLLLRRRR